MCVHSNVNCTMDVTLVVLHDPFMLTDTQMCSLSVDTMKEKGLTEGAAKKLNKKLEELRLVAYCGW